VLINNAGIKILAIRRLGAQKYSEDHRSQRFGPLLLCHAVLAYLSLHKDMEGLSIWHLHLSSECWNLHRTSPRSITHRSTKALALKPARATSGQRYSPYFFSRMAWWLNQRGTNALRKQYPLRAMSQSSWHWLWICDINGDFSILEGFFKLQDRFRPVPGSGEQSLLKMCWHRR